jgi:hypothetical protein
MVYALLLAVIVFIFSINRETETYTIMGVLAGFIIIAMGLTV